MQSLHDALATCGLSNIAVTTAHSLAILATSYPPSTTYFRKDLIPVICPILTFHAKTGSPFLINAYPYFAYAAQPNHVDLEYALLDSSYGGILDNGTGLTYPNMLLAQVDAVYHAINAAGMWLFIYKFMRTHITNLNLFLFHELILYLLNLLDPDTSGILYQIIEATHNGTGMNGSYLFLSIPCHSQCMQHN